MSKRSRSPSPSSTFAAQTIVRSATRPPTVSLHGDNPKDSTFIVYNRVNWGGNVIIGLSKKVDEVIKDILAYEGNKGYGDFKI
jgi:hypothetical protein